MRAKEFLNGSRLGRNRYESGSLKQLGNRTACRQVWEFEMYGSYVAGGADERLALRLNYDEDRNS